MTEPDFTVISMFMQIMTETIQSIDRNSKGKRMLGRVVLKLGNVEVFSVEIRKREWEKKRL